MSVEYRSKYSCYVIKVLEQTLKKLFNLRNIRIYCINYCLTLSCST